MTLYETWCEMNYDQLLHLQFDLRKHLCSLTIPRGVELIADTSDWRSDIRKLYKEYVNCNPPSGRHLNFIPANTKKVHPIDLSENFEQARVALEAYVYLHWLKGDIIWDNPGWFIRICRNCDIHKNMIVKEK